MTDALLPPYKVFCVYRRSEREMGGRQEERQHAGEEGVKFLFQAAPVEVLAGPGGRLRAVTIQRMELQAPDISGRPRPVPVPGSETDIAADTVVVAIGYRVEESLVEATSGVEAARLGTVVAAEDGATGRPGVFAAGDCVRGADLVVTAVADARRAAAAIDRYLASA